MPKAPFLIRPNKFTGYVADPSSAPPEKLSYPSVNCMINENGEVEQRLGTTVEDIDLNQANKSARSFYSEKYDVVVFTVGTVVKYYDFNDSSVYDTGLTLTDGTICRGDWFEGDLYITNTTDGARRLVFGRLRGDATAASANLNIDYDMAARLERFGKTSGNVVIQGTAEAFTGASTSNGRVTGTNLSQNYSDNAVCVVVHDISGVTGIEKWSKIFFWKRRLGGIGSEVAGNSDQPNNTAYYGKFAAPTSLEDTIVFDYATGGSTRELVGNYGRLTNVVPAQDYLWQLTDREAYVTAASSVTISGSGIGTTTPDIRDPDHGCFNEDCATTLGSGEFSYIDAAAKRIMRGKIATNAGAAVPYVDDSYDMPIRSELQGMDLDQTGAIAYQWKGGRMTIHQVKVNGQFKWYIHDKRINDWQPPQQVITASSFFERKGVLYATDAEDDTVYSIFTSFADDGNSINCEIWTGELSIGDAMIREAQATGIITQAANVKLRSYVTNMNGGRRTGSEKSVDGSTFSYDPNKSIGTLPVGTGSATPTTESYARWKITWDVFPSEGHTVQVGVTQDMEGGYFRLSTLQISGKYADSYTPSQ